MNGKGQDLRFKMPFTLLLAGGSGSGKSTLITQMVARWREVLDHKPTHIYIAHSHNQPAYQAIIDHAPCPVTLVNGLPDSLETEPGSLLIIDDLALDRMRQIKDWHVRKSHHFQCSVLTVTQNCFEQGFRTISLNSHYLVIHKNPRDGSQILHLSKQLCSGNTNFLCEAYLDSTSEPYSYILCDLRQETNNLYRYRSSIFPSEAVVYVCPNLVDIAPWYGI